MQDRAPDPVWHHAAVICQLNGRDFLCFKLEPPGAPTRMGAVGEVGA